MSTMLLEKKPRNSTREKMLMSKRFKVDFSGKGYPSYRPISLKMNAPDEVQAEEWVKKQLEVWKLKSDIKYSITEISKEKEPVKEDVKEKAPKKKKKE